MTSSSTPQTCDEVATGPLRELSSAEVLRLYQTHAHRLLAHGRRLSRDEALSRDAIQDTFLLLLQRGGSLEQTRSPVAWLHTLTRNRCIDLLRRRRSTRELTAQSWKETPAPALPMEERNLLLVLFQRLNPRQLQIAKLLGAGLSQQEVAGDIGCSRQAVHKCVLTIRRLAEELA
ncbi:MAG: sigma-70 family RNA polymerase sigma factor [Deltaproteobacteria bacterium]